MFDPSSLYPSSLKCDLTKCLKKLSPSGLLCFSYLHLTTAAEKKMVAWEAGTEDQNCCSRRRTQGNEKLQKIF